MEHNADENDLNKTTVDDIFSLDGGPTFSQSLHIDTDTVEMPGRTAGAGTCDLASWAFSPIPVMSPSEPKSAQQFHRAHSDQPNTPGIQGSEYIYNSMATQDYYTMYQNHMTHDFHHLYQWYCTANYQCPSVPDRLYKAGSVQNVPMSVPYSPVSVPCEQNSGTDVNRCSTPELISALASIAPESESRQYRCISPLLSEANQVLSDDASCEIIKEEPSIEVKDSASVDYVHSTSTVTYQDSGYNSEMGMSPVYPYESKSSTLSSADVSFDDGNKENDSDVDCMAMCQPQKVFTMINYTSGQARPSDMLQKLCERQIQSNDISSTDLVTSMTSYGKSDYRPIQSKPIMYRPDGKAFVCHKMPPLVQHKPNVKRGESSAKRKISDLEVQDQMNREKSRQRHNQPLNLKAVSIMTGWYESHLENPYPTKAEKEEMARQGGITLTQVKSWFANKRNRSNNTKPNYRNGK
ncbi:hypothetical protein FSP39_000634 [Pinctada imbricata]|uniref:Homeobox domain-containing protein n=1 Tax=Pinctada imbricata TaxID=66713 RepID=A0AA89CBS3_PINIB|nr:hypothetical protein FSP39_000634 [Pinctada imbricata]